MKRVITLILALALCAGLTALPASAAGTVKDPQHISAGDWGSAVVDANGVLWMCGYNRDNEVPGAPKESATGLVRVMDGVVSVRCCFRSTFAIKTDGSLWTWGESVPGGGGKGSATPTKIGDNVVFADGDMYSGSTYGYVTADGALYIWDREQRIGGIANSTTPVKVMDDVVSFSCYGGNIAAVKKDGALYSWGRYNEEGEQGNGTTKPSATPVKILDGVASVSLGSATCFAVKKDGSLWGWGLCFEKAMGTNVKGNGENIGHAPIQTVPYRLMDGVASVHTTGITTIARKTDNSLWAWGSNYHCLLGIGWEMYTDEQESYAVKVMDDVAEADIGEVHCIAAKTDGSVWTWGSNSNADGSGRLGYEDGNFTDIRNGGHHYYYQTSPRQVPGATVAAGTKPETKPEPKPEPVKDPVKTPAARPSQKKGFTSSEKVTVWFDMTRDSDVGVLYDIIASNDSDKRVEDYYCIVIKTTGGSYFCAFLNLALDPGACVKKNQNLGDRDLEEKIVDIAWIRFDDAADRTSFMKDYGVKWSKQDTVGFDTSDYAFMTNEDMAASLFRH